MNSTTEKALSVPHLHFSFLVPTTDRKNLRQYAPFCSIPAGAALLRFRGAPCAQLDAAAASATEPDGGPARARSLRRGAAFPRAGGCSRRLGLSWAAQSSPGCHRRRGLGEEADAEWPAAPRRKGWLPSQGSGARRGHRSPRTRLDSPIRGRGGSAAAARWPQRAPPGTCRGPPPPRPPARGRWLAAPGGSGPRRRLAAAAGAGGEQAAAGWLRQAAAEMRLPPSLAPAWQAHDEPRLTKEHASTARATDIHTAWEKEVEGTPRLPQLSAATAPENAQRYSVQTLRLFNVWRCGEYVSSLSQPSESKKWG
ncbi:uncharacterized protein LOC128335578 [Hemicordylus capensis]|uniref:uncharacterized protein LOC128335578 n=1 Tax=Hemicordylus capensis TaxID=884348 RepID=UPI002302B34A|nr:uncharacterized protein LOC128335578 [Hemicordylus capensis]